MARLETPNSHGSDKSISAPVVSILLILLVVGVRELKDAIPSPVGESSDGPDQHTGGDLPAKVVGPTMSEVKEGDLVCQERTLSTAPAPCPSPPRPLRAG